MSSSVRACLAAFAAAAFFFAAPPEGLSQTPPAACEARYFEGAVFTLCQFDARTQDLRLVWRSPSGKAYRRLSVLSRELGEAGAAKLRFAMNAGMFDPSGAPIGLLWSRAPC